jgi:ribosomal protein S18 acetylase RimI-like enzyme
MNAITIEAIGSDRFAACLDDLTGILHAAVNGGASVNFILPYTPDDARAFWLEKVRPALPNGGRILLVARCRERIVGTVQLILDLPPNQAHRAEVTKLLVHPDSRRCGIGERLMIELEAQARAHGRSLVTLDTTTGSAAERLYRRLGYRVTGCVPAFSLAPDGSGYDATTYMYKVLRAAVEGGPAVRSPPATFAASNSS